MALVLYNKKPGGQMTTYKKPAAKAKPVAAVVVTKKKSKKSKISWNPLTKNFLRMKYVRTGELATNAVIDNTGVEHPYSLNCINRPFYL